MARPLSPLGVRVAFWEGLGSGLSVTVAAEVAGVSRPTGYRWLREHRRVSSSVPAPVVARVGSLLFREREEIAFQLARGFGVRHIARILGRPPSTVSREVARNGVRGRYLPSVAQEQTRTRARRPRPSKLDGLALREQVIAMLKDKSSPEQIAGRLRIENPNTPEMQVSHETIYQALYVQGRGSLRAEVADALRSGRIARRPQKLEGPRPQRFKDPMVMISDRPAEVEDRAVPGHWEGDLILGSTASGSAIGTLVERSTGFVMLLHLDGDHTARTVADAMIAAMNTLPEQLRRSTTWDQGSEMSRHKEITMATGMPIYFCDPHSPWQRGSNENTNGLLRQYFPKGTDLSFHGPGILENVAAEMNRRPRKRHGYLTPAEVLAKLLSNPTNQTGVATTT
jgi:IS30 family transposase